MRSCSCCLMLMLMLMLILANAIELLICVCDPFQEAPYINAQCPGHILYLCLNEVLKILSRINMRRRTHKPDGQTINNAHTHTALVCNIWKGIWIRCICAWPSYAHTHTYAHSIPFFISSTSFPFLFCCLHPFTSQLTHHVTCAMSEIHLPNIFNILAAYLCVQWRFICSCVCVNGNKNETEETEEEQEGNSGLNIACLLQCCYSKQSN